MTDWIFVKRVLIVFAIGALAATLWALSDILLLVFGAALVGVVLRALMEPVARYCRISESWALLGVVLAVLAVIASVTVPFGAQLAAQTEYLVEQLPLAVHTLAQEFDLGASAEALRTSALGTLALRIFSWGSSLAGALSGLVLLIAGGIYLASDPSPYRRGFITLFPERWRENIDATLSDAGNALRLWLRAQMIAMALVGTMTAVGMWLIGVPSFLALGLIAGLTEFVPIVGPIIGAVPAVLLASTQGMEMALWALGVAIAVQQIENNLIMPLLIGRVVQVPAAVGMFAVVAIGVVFGPLGLLLGYPLAIVIDVAVRRLYVRETLGEPIQIAAEGTRHPVKRARKN